MRNYWAYKSYLDTAVITGSVLPRGGIGLVPEVFSCRGWLVIPKNDNHIRLLFTENNFTIKGKVDKGKKVIYATNITINQGERK